MTDDVQARAARQLKHAIFPEMGWAAIVRDLLARLAQVEAERDEARKQARQFHDEATNSHEAFVCASGAIQDRDARLAHLDAGLAQLEQQMRNTADPRDSEEWADAIATFRQDQG